MHRSYVTKEWMDSFVNNDKTPLPKDAATRFFSIVRVKPDEKVAVFDGFGREVSGYVHLDKKSNFATLVNGSLRTHPIITPQIVLLQAAIDETKLSETIKRGCEYGVDQFIIFEASKSEHFSYQKLQAKQDRLLRIAQDASRQSERQFIPTLTFKDSLSFLIDDVQDREFGVFGDVRDKKRLSSVLKEAGEIKRNFFVVVGPEGGLLDSECAFLRKAGFKGVSWAPYTLRSELAGLAAVAIFNAFCGRA